VQTTEEASQPQPTERQQFWLDHIARCDAAGQLSKEYAAAHGLSVQGMYSARKDLVERGALAPDGRGVRKSRSRAGTLQLQLRGFARTHQAGYGELAHRTAAA